MSVRDNKVVTVTLNLAGSDKLKADALERLQSVEELVLSYTLAQLGNTGGMKFQVNNKLTEFTFDLPPRLWQRVGPENEKLEAVFKGIFQSALRLHGNTNIVKNIVVKARYK